MLTGPMKTENKTMDVAQRYHALDGLRVTMMLLGLGLHSAITYVPTEFRDPSAWPYFDPTESRGLLLLVVFIHWFRMPVFFAMAGFFAALLSDRRGVDGMIQNRFQRVGLPLLAGWLIVPALMLAATLFANTQNRPEADILGGASFGVFWASLHHLWFLYHLLIFCLCAWVTIRIAAICELRFGTVDLFARAVISKPLGMTSIAVVTAVLLFLMDEPGKFGTSNGFVPALPILAVHALCFVFGWALYRHRNFLDTFGRNARRNTALTVVACAVWFWTAGELDRDRGNVALALFASLAGALFMWAAIHGFIGLFLKHMNRPSRFIRYLSDSAYWVYLLHLPVVIAVQGLLAKAVLPAEAKFTSVLVSVAVICLATYHFGVRSTVVGVFLNGRRYPVAGGAAVQVE
jgi:peptidoglycan/LPS O-acetylase OafA/YrhL